MARETLLPVSHNLDLDTLVMPVPSQHGRTDCHVAHMQVIIQLQSLVAGCEIPFLVMEN